MATRTTRNWTPFSGMFYRRAACPRIEGLPENLLQPRESHEAPFTISANSLAPGWARQRVWHVFCLAWIAPRPIEKSSGRANGIIDVWSKRGRHRIRRGGHAGRSAVGMIGGQSLSRRICPTPLRRALACGIVGLGLAIFAKNAVGAHLASRVSLDAQSAKGHVSQVAR
jgi:hypothetical protein